jgi:hypothetical protein
MPARAYAHLHNKPIAAADAASLHLNLTIAMYVAHARRPGRILLLLITREISQAGKKALC